MTVSVFGFASVQASVPYSEVATLDFQCTLEHQKVSSKVQGLLLCSNLTYPFGGPLFLMA